MSGETNFIVDAFLCSVLDALGLFVIESRTLARVPFPRASFHGAVMMPWRPRFILLSRFAPRTGLVNLRQTFVLRCHAGNVPAVGSRMSKEPSSALHPEQELASMPMAQGGLSRLAIARLKSAGVPVTPLLKRVGLTPELIADPKERLSVRLASRWPATSICANSGSCTTSWRLR